MPRPFRTTRSCIPPIAPASCSGRPWRCSIITGTSTKRRSRCCAPCWPPTSRTMSCIFTWGWHTRPRTASIRPGWSLRRRLRSATTTATHGSRWPTPTSSRRKWMRRSPTRTDLQRACLRAGPPGERWATCTTYEKNSRRRFRFFVKQSGSIPPTPLPGTNSAARWNARVTSPRRRRRSGAFSPSSPTMPRRRTTSATCGPTKA